MKSELMERWMNMVEFKITEGSDFGWNCFGPNAYTLSYWNQELHRAACQQNPAYCSSATQRCQPP